MKITVTFDSLDEFEAFKGTAVVAPQSAQKPVEEPETPKAKKSAPKEEMPWKEASAEAEAPKKAAAPAVTEDFRVEVRKALAQLNKKDRRKCREGAHQGIWRLQAHRGEA